MIQQFTRMCGNIPIEKAGRRRQTTASLSDAVTFTVQEVSQQFTRMCGNIPIEKAIRRRQPTASLPGALTWGYRR